MHRNLLTLVAVFWLAACGGGSSPSTVTSSPNTGEPSRPEVVERLPFPYAPSGHYRTDGLSAPAPSDAKHMPIYRDNAQIFVGADQGPDGVVPVVGQRGTTQIRFGRLNDGAGRQTVATYLAQASGDVARRGSTPTVRIVGPASTTDMAKTIRAVQMINAALPETAKISVGASLPGFSLRGNVRQDGRYYASGTERANTIHIEFVPAHDYRRGPGSAAVAYTLGRGASYIQFNMGANSYPRDNESTILLAHELMHAIADFTHVSSSFATILEGTGDIHNSMQNGQRQPLSLLYPVDREALQAFFRSSDPTNLGAWSASATRIDGNGPNANYGVALRNGYAEPWAYGPLPNTDLRNSRELSGHATWTGSLVGLTPQAAAVLGDATIAVNLTTMNGQADFTNLETWAANTDPGNAGTGTQWLDGDLGYTIAVTGNSFRETSGDAGRLTGVFTGSAHEGAAGTLDRTDLTAAFGAERE